jgi:predicted enzyme related to lactoylglutathione lyase
MERVTGIGGVFFRAGDDRQGLLAWYRDHLGLDPAEWGGMVFDWHRADEAQGGSTTWAIFPPDTDYFGDRGSTYMINYRVEDLDRMLDQLRAAGVQVDDRVEESEFGRFGWAVDPDGNRFELWQPAPGL